MAKRLMTNIEKVQRIMRYSRYGALAQMFVMDALSKWSDIISNASTAQVDNGFVDPESWIGVAREIKDTLKSDLTVDDHEHEEDETPFGEIHFECNSDCGRDPNNGDPAKG